MNSRLTLPTGTSPRPSGYCLVITEKVKLGFKLTFYPLGFTNGMYPNFSSPKVILLQQPWLAAHAWKARRITSTIRWEVKTLPPTTAASSEGSWQAKRCVSIDSAGNFLLIWLTYFGLTKIDPSGITTRTGLRQPWFKGISCPTRHLLREIKWRTWRWHLDVGKCTSGSKWELTRRLL